MKRLLWLVGLWVVFSVGCFVAPVLGAVFWLMPRDGYSRRFVKAADRMLAAILGFSGRHTLSAEVAAHPDWKWMHDILNEVQPNHCEEQAFEEHLYCRLSDHKELGDK